jgi:hypothetical protein
VSSNKRGSLTDRIVRGPVTQLAKKRSFSPDRPQSTVPDGTGAKNEFDNGNSSAKNPSSR